MKNKGLLIITILQLFICISLSSQSQMTEDQYFAWKTEMMEKVLGKMYDMVDHSLIPFDLGGNVDMYFFPQKNGTAMSTMELLNRDYDIPAESKIGTYELVGFTKNNIDSPKFKEIERQLCKIFTIIGNYSAEEILNPKETCEIPDDDGTICLILDEYKTDGQLDINGKKHGLLLVIQIFEDEMNYAMEYGGEKLLTLLKAKGYYPYSDLNRKSVLK